MTANVDASCNLDSFNDENPQGVGNMCNWLRTSMTGTVKHAVLVGHRHWLKAFVTRYGGQLGTEVKGGYLVKVEMNLNGKSPCQVKSAAVLHPSGIPESRVDDNTSDDPDRKVAMVRTPSSAGAVHEKKSIFSGFSRIFSKQANRPNV